MKKHRLKALAPHEISLVGLAANGKRSLVHKAGQPPKKPGEDKDEVPGQADGPPKPTDDKATQDPDDNGVQPGKPDAEANDKAPEDGSQPPTPAPAPQQEVRTLSLQAQAALAAVARLIAPHKDELTDADLDAVQDEVGIPAAPMPDPAAETPPFGGETPDQAAEDPEQPTDDAPEVPAAEDEEQPGQDDSPAAAGESEDDEMADKQPVKKNESGEGSTTERFEAVLKSMEASQQELVQKNADLATALQAVTAKLEEVTKSNVQKAYIAKAASFDRLGADHADLADVLQAVDSVDPAKGEKLLGILKTANEQLAVGDEHGDLLREIGSRASGGSAPQGPQAELDALIDGAVQKSAGAKSRAQVASQVLKSREGKALMKRIENEKAVKRGQPKPF